jgi:hypothetical protein
MALSIPCIECNFAECCNSFNIMLSVVMLNVAMLSVVAPFYKIGTWLKLNRRLFDPE